MAKTATLQEWVEQENVQQLDASKRLELFVQDFKMVPQECERCDAEEPDPFCRLCGGDGVYFKGNRKKT